MAWTVATQRRTGTPVSSSTSPTPGGFRIGPLKTPTSFAISLEQQPKCAMNGVPIIVESCLNYFTEIATEYVGLFRIPGSERRVQQMWDYMQDHPRARLFDSCVTTFMRKHPYFTADDVADFLKRFITSIIGNEPVITYNCYAPLVSLVDAMCPAHLIAEKARRIIHQLLVPARRALLGRLCKFLKDFSQHEKKTTMDCRSLSVCFGYLMPAPSESQERLSAETELKQSSLDNSQAHIAESIIAEQIRTSVFTKTEKKELCVSVMGILIQHANRIFVPCLSPPRPPRFSSKTRRSSSSKTRRTSSSGTRDSSSSGTTKTRGTSSGTRRTSSSGTRRTSSSGTRCTSSSGTRRRSSSKTRGRSSSKTRHTSSSGTRHTSSSGTRHTSSSGTRHSSSSGTRHSSSSGTRRTSSSGTRRTSSSGTRHSSSSGTRRTSSSGTRRTSSSGTRHTSSSGTRHTSSSGTRRRHRKHRDMGTKPAKRQLTLKQLLKHNEQSLSLHLSMVAIDEYM